MDRYFKMLPIMLFALSAAVFICGITGARTLAALQDDADEEPMTEEEYEAYMVEYEAYQAEYAAWEAADKESDMIKSGAMLLEFIKEKPGSKLSPYAEGSYLRLLSKAFNEEKYQELEPLAEQWNDYKPGNEEIVRMIAIAAKELKHTEKFLQALEVMYKQKPSLGLARDFRDVYKETGNDAGYVEWTETILKEETDSLERYRLYNELFQHFSEKKDSPKMLQYAQLTLNSLDQLQNPDDETARALPDIRHMLNHFIGIFYYNDEKLDDAIEHFMKALEQKKYANGYYLIANSLWKQQKTMNAMFSFAKAQHLGESDEASEEDKTIAPKAKDNMEQLYKAMQGGSLVGIDRRYKRAQDMSDEDLIKPME